MGPNLIKSTIQDCSCIYMVIGGISVKIFQGQYYNNMILSAETINKARYYVNHSDELQLDLREKNISEIGGMAATLNYFQSIDLSNNLITSINNISYLDRLKSLVLANNKITTICDLGEWLPSLQNLFLMNNRIKQLEQINNLAGCQHLSNLVLNNNPICEKVGYRKYVVARVGSLKALDFKKIQKRQKDEAKNTF